MNSFWRDSVVLIASSDPDNNRFGTGFVVHVDEDIIYVLTCAHVVKDVGGLTKIEVNGVSGTVVVSGEENGLDLAVLKFNW